VWPLLFETAIAGTIWAAGDWWVMASGGDVVDDRAG